jgi:hypothetical protein
LSNSEDVVKTVTRTILTAGAILMMVGAAAAQAPEGVRPAVHITTTPPPPPPGTASSPLAVRERLLSFDADKDLRISRDELPERMQGLIARGDKNANGALDFDEIHALVNAAASERTRVSFRPQPSEGLPGVISDLKLSPAKREQALAILSAPKIAPNVNQPAGGDLNKAMRLLLDDEEYENFAAAAARLAKTVQVRMGTSDGIVRR